MYAIKYGENPGAIAGIEGKEAFRGVFGGYNDLPNSAREISREEAEAKLYHDPYMPVAVESRQIFKGPWVEKFGRSFDVRLYFWRDGSGIAVASIYRNSGKYEARFLAFESCDHDMRGMSPEECREAGIYHAGRCYRVSKCEKCGYVVSLDSSD
jgi:hypothetical protein